MTRICVQTIDEQKESVMTAIRKIDSESFFDSESNPITFWVTTNLTPANIMRIDGVQDAIYSCQQ